MNRKPSCFKIFRKNKYIFTSAVNTFKAINTEIRNVNFTRNKAVSLNYLKGTLIEIDCT